MLSEKHGCSKDEDITECKQKMRGEVVNTVDGRNDGMDQKEAAMGELAFSSPRLYFVVAGMSLQEHPDSSLCLHPET